MTRTSLQDLNCSWAQGAEVIGDKWSILILRDAMKGVNTFSGFEQSIGLSKKVLTQRLDSFLEKQIFEKRPGGPDRKRSVYALTEKGRALFTTIIALGQWADEWVFGPGNEPVTVVERASGQPIDKVNVTGAGKTDLKITDVIVISQSNDFATVTERDA